MTVLLLYINTMTDEYQQAPTLNVSDRQIRIGAKQMWYLWNDFIYMVKKFQQNLVIKCLHKYAK